MVANMTPNDYCRAIIVINNTSIIIMINYRTITIHEYAIITINCCASYNKMSFLVQIKFITEDSNGLYYKY